MQHIAGATVKQSMVPSGRSGKQFALFEQCYPETAQGQIMGQGTTDAAADDDDMFQFSQWIYL